MPPFASAEQDFTMAWWEPQHIVARDPVPWCSTNCWCACAALEALPSPLLTTMPCVVDLHERDLFFESFFLGPLYVGVDVSRSSNTVSLHCTGISIRVYLSSDFMPRPSTEPFTSDLSSDSEVDSAIVAGFFRPCRFCVFSVRDGSI